MGMPQDANRWPLQALTCPLHTNVIANNESRKVVYGGTTYPLSVIKLRLFWRLWCLTNLTTWTNRPWTGTNFLRTYLTDADWTEAGNWRWSNGNNAQLTLDASDEKAFHDPECHFILPTMVFTMFP